MAALPYSPRITPELAYALDWTTHFSGGPPAKSLKIVSESMYPHPRLEPGYALAIDD